MQEVTTMLGRGWHDLGDAFLYIDGDTPAIGRHVAIMMSKSIATSVCGQVSIDWAVLLHFNLHGLRIAVVSYYLPHQGHGRETYLNALSDLTTLVSGINLQKVILCGDSNVALATPSSGAERLALGWAQMGEPESSHRPEFMHFLLNHELFVANSHRDHYPEIVSPSFYPRAAGAPRTIDHILVGNALASCVRQITVHDTLLGSSDHRCVSAQFCLPGGLRIRPRRIARPAKGSPFQHLMHDAVITTFGAEPWQEDPCKFFSLATDRALQMLPPVPKSRRADATLSAMLHQRANTVESSQRLALTKLIWQRKKELKRKKADDALLAATSRLSRHTQKTPQPLSFPDGDGRDLYGDAAMQAHARFWSQYWDQGKHQCFLQALVECWDEPDHWSGTPVQVTDVGLQQVLQNLPKGRAADTHGITYEAVCAMDEDTQHLLVECINVVWRLLEKPDTWARCTVRLLAKSASPKSVKDFRPIAILDVIARIAAKLALRSCSHVWHCVPQWALGFRPGYSTDHLLGTFTQLIEKHHEWGRPLWACKLDISKAFDTINRTTVVQALRWAQLTPWESWALLSVLPTHLQLRWHDLTSEDIDSTSGLVQGSPVSPVLFVVTLAYILRDVVPHLLQGPTAVRLQDLVAVLLTYADDILVLATDLPGLQHNVDLIIHACNAHGLDFAPNKFALVTNAFGCAQLADPTADIPVQGILLRPSMALTILGVHLDMNNNRTVLLDYALIRAARSFGAVRGQLLQKRARVRHRL
eukprot:6431230-Amphidinium_carterae.1